MFKNIWLVSSMEERRLYTANVVGSIPTRATRIRLITALLLFCITKKLTCYLFGYRIRVVQRILTPLVVVRIHVTKPNKIFIYTLNWCNGSTLVCGTNRKGSKPLFSTRFIRESSNGRKAAFDPVNLGSNPSSRSNMLRWPNG